jgi:hypothetical protein
MTPDEVVDGLRAIRARISEMTPLTAAQRTALRNRIRTSNPVLQASISVIGALDAVSQAVGQPAEEVRQLADESNRWIAVEDELRAMLNGVSGANLMRRHRLAFIAGQAYIIGTRLALDPANAILLPHVEEVKRLKSFRRRRKAAQAPALPPSPAPTADPEEEGSSPSGDPQP